MLNDMVHKGIKTVHSICKGSVTFVIAILGNLKPTVTLAISTLHVKAVLHFCILKYILSYTPQSIRFRVITK